MKRTMSLIVYSGKDLPVFRKDWELPNITVAEFDPVKHQGKVFMYPERDILKGEQMDINGMYMWQSCCPENNEEENELVLMGKIPCPIIKGTYGSKKELLYKTEDNWFVFEKDTYPTYKVCSDFSIMQFAACDANPVGSNAKYFHNEKAANEYVLMHKPFLSIKDVEDYLNTVKTVSPTYSYIREIKEMVRQRELARLKAGSADR